VLALMSIYLTTSLLTGAIGAGGDVMPPRCRNLVIQAEFAIRKEDEAVHRTIKWPYRCTPWKR
jgi:hypothetical protein